MTWFARVVLVCLLGIVPLGGAFADDDITLEGDFVQGGFVVGRAPAGSIVTYEGRTLRLSSKGIFAFGFGRDAAPAAQLIVTLPGGTRVVRELAVADRTFDIQRIDGLPPKLVTPPPEVLSRIRAEGARVRAARAADSAWVDFSGGFAWPSLGRISGVYGSQRILNGEPRQPHYGVDIAAPVGRPVLAPAGGVVSLVEPDLYFSGGTLLIDHGHGISSSFLHLSRIDVEAGQRVEQGDLIGAIGATGRVTGAHLDWRINWFDQRLDPALLVGPMPPTSIGPAPVRP